MKPKIERKQIEQKKVYSYAFWLSISIALIGSFLLYYIGSRVVDVIYQSQLYSLATNIISSILFSIVFSYFSNKEFLNLLAEDLNLKTNVISRDVSEIIQKQNTKHIPSHVYHPTKSIDPDFNKKLSNDLSNSSFYFFYGISAKYVPIRIKYTKHHLSFARVIIFNPLDEYSINLRATDRMRNPKYSNKKISVLQEEIKQEIYSCIIALYDIKNICPIEIAYTSGTSVIRTEIFDHALYISMYHTDDAYSQAFPETYRYNSESIMFNIYIMDFARQFEICKEKYRFDNKMVVSDLKDHLQKIGMQDITDDNLERLRKNNESFSEKFVQESLISKAHE